MSWDELAAGLGFTPHAPLIAYDAELGFRQLERALGPRAGPPPSELHWLRGEHRGHRALVISHQIDDGVSWTTAIVEIDPPLLVGAAFSEGGVFRRLLLGAADVSLGAAVDKRLRVTATASAQLQALLLTPAGDPGFLDALARQVGRVTVGDSAVACPLTQRDAGPDVARAALDDAAWLAGELAVRRVAVPPSPAEVAERRRWRELAAVRSLVFDAHRMQLRGTIAGAHVEVALEPQGPSLFTAIGVRFPRPIGVLFDLRNIGAYGMASRWFGQAIHTGDPAFDTAFVLRGLPEEPIKQVFAHPALRATLVSLARRASELTMTHDGMFWRWPVAAVDATKLEDQLDAAVTATESIFGALEAIHPYR